MCIYKAKQALSTGYSLLPGLESGFKRVFDSFIKSANTLNFSSRQNRHDVKGQDGRSMIEMLGVLAIIGVLSIGGIAGYSKAMTKYRVNKTADQITQLAQNIRTLYASQKNYSTLNRDVVKKAHLAPEDMYESTDSTNLYNPFGGSISLGSSSKMSSGDNKAFYIIVYKIPDEACIELITKDWGTGFLPDLFL